MAFENFLNIFENPLFNINSFITFLNSIQHHNNLYLYISNLKIDENLLNAHKKLFPWHHKDSIRSFTNPDISKLTPFEFSYANRIQKYFGYSQLKHVLTNNIINIWDPQKDPNSRVKPCLLVLKFIKTDNKLNLTVIWRKRDILKRLIPNIFCLINLLKNESIKHNLTPGIITDFSIQIILNENEKNKFINYLKNFKKENKNE